MNTIEPLESRIAPATLVNPTTLTYTDIDGDQVTVTTSAGAFVFTNPPNGTGFVDTFVFTAANAIGGQQLQLIDLRQGSGFQGADLTVSVVKAGGGDGLAAVGLIFAPGIDLGTVTMKGDLGEIDCGDANTATPGLKTLSVRSMGRYGDATDTLIPGLNSDIKGALGALRVSEDIKEASIEVTASVNADAKIGSITIGGSLIGGAVDGSGQISASGDIGPVKIGRDVIGGAGDNSGAIGTAGKIASVTIGGSLIGGSGSESGRIGSAGEIGAVRIVGNVIGGSAIDSGQIFSDSKLGSLTIGGSLLGGAGEFSASVVSTGDIGPVKIAHDVRGGSGDESGKVDAGGKLGSVTIGGSFIGGDGDYNTFNSGGFIHRAQVFAIGGIGAVTIGHDLTGGAGIASGGILAVGKLASLSVGGSIVGGMGGDSARVSSFSDSIGPVKIGHDVQGGAGPNSGSLTASGALAGLTIGGSLLGGAGSGSGTIFIVRALGLVKIGHDLVGGAGPGSGVIETASLDGEMAGVSIGGSVIGGSGIFSGAILSNADIVSLRIGHDLVGGSIRSAATMDLIGSGYIESDTRIGSISIGGSIIAGTDSSAGFDLLQNASIRADGDIGSLTVKGGLIGNVGSQGNSFVIISASGQATPGATTDVAIGRITIGGRAEYAQIFAGYDTTLDPMNADAQIGSVSVGADWVASSIVAGAVNLGPNLMTGGGDDNINFGDESDAKITDPGESMTINSKIGSITIAGQVFATPSTFVNEAERFGFVAEQIGALKIGAATFTLNPGKGNDARFLVQTNDMSLHELGGNVPAVPLPTASAKLVNASTVTYDDIDGDHVTVKFSKPLLTSAVVANTVFKFDTGMVDDGTPAYQQLQLIDLAALAIPATNGVSVTVTVTPGGGDQLANIGYINSTGFDLGTVTIPGDLGQLDAGVPTPGKPGVKTLSVRTLGRFDVDTQPPMSATFTPSLLSNIMGGLGALTVKQDITRARIDVVGSIGAVAVGGSLIGGTQTASGAIFTSQSIGPVKIGHHVQGGVAGGSGQIDAGTSIASLAIGGSIIGGEGSSGANVNADGTTLGAVKIAHNVLGGTGPDAASLSANVSISSVTIAGSLLGGLGGSSGSIHTSIKDIGAVKIGHNVLGSSAGNTGKINSAGKLASLTIGGSLIGGGGGDSGAVITAGDMGAVKIAHNLAGAGGGDSGNLQAGGKLTSASIGGSILGAGGGDSGEITSIGDMGPVRIGHDFSGGGGGTSGNIFTDGKLASLTIGGSLVGGPASSSGRIRSEMDMGAVKIGHDMIGGSGSGAGDLLGGGKLAAVSIGGSLIGGSADETGEIHFTGDIGAVRIGRDLVGGSITGGSLNETGYIDSVTGRIGSVAIGGSIISGIDDSTTGGLTMNASIRAGDDISALTVKGSLIGNVTPNGASLVIISAHGQAMPVGDKNLAIGKITIGGRVERANIFGGYSVDLVPADGVQIGTVKVGRDWIASNLVVGVTNLGADDSPGGTGINADNVNFGDTHDTFIGLGSIANRIAAIVIGGVVAGTAASGDHFGFSSVSIGSFKSLGFTAGASDDVIELSPITHDVTFREI